MDRAEDIAALIKEIAPEETILRFAVAQYPKFGHWGGKFWIGFDTTSGSHTLYGPIRSGKISRYTLSENTTKCTQAAAALKAAKDYEVIQSIDWRGIDEGAVFGPLEEIIKRLSR